MGRFFNIDSPIMNGLNKLADLIWLNILTFICCIPIITTGAAITALNYVALKMVRNEEGYVTRAYFKSFKENFKQATIIWLIMLLIIAVIIGDLFIFVYSGIAFPSWIKIALIAISVLAVFATMHVFPILARFENTVANTFKNSLYMGILSLPKTVLMMVIWLVPIIISLYMFQIFPLVIGLGISGPVFLSAMLYNKTFKKFEPEEENTNDDSTWTIAEGEEPPLTEEEQGLEEKKDEQSKEY
ncbi:MAG: DUF624 domain-containing protein [Lachnospiraceae bacterium]|nr:DUF624 domain-containing protein [Lachnospiraceae bacterium]